MANAPKCSVRNEQRLYGCPGVIATPVIRLWLSFGVRYV
jgi:hypothetical protein